VKLMRGDDLHVLTGSYALDALAGPERKSFEHHLAHCIACRAEVRGLRETAARLAMARALRPPPPLRARVLAAAYLTRQLRPPAARHQPGRARV
jgi:anti-sigma factor RsiW